MSRSGAIATDRAIRQVCVVGNAAIDRTFRVARLPQPGETAIALDARTVRGACVENAISGRSDGRDFGGKGANQALISARAGVPTSLFAALGNDMEGDLYVSHLASAGVDTQHIHRGEEGSDISIITVDQAGENTIVTQNDAAAAYRPCVADVLAVTHPGDWVMMQGNLDARVTATLLREARLAGRQTFLNPGPVQFDCLPMLGDVDILVVNQVESNALTHEIRAERAAVALRLAGARDVFVTLGKEGVAHLGASGLTRARAMEAVAVDTVGAGDVFCGVLIAGLARHLTHGQALCWAQAAAAFTVTRAGAQRSFPTSGQLEAMLPTDNECLTRSDAK